MKVKLSVDFELYIPNELKDKSHQEIIDFIDQSMRDQLYVGTVYSTEDPCPYAQASEMNIVSLTIM